MTDSHKALLFTPNKKVLADYWRRRARETTGKLRRVFLERADELLPVGGFYAFDIMQSIHYSDWWSDTGIWPMPNEKKVQP